MRNGRETELSSAYVALRVTYGVVPVVAGLDKFFNVLTDWQRYLPGFARDLSPVAPEALMQLVGVIEIAAGLAVLALIPRLGAYVVMAWLVLVGVMAAAAGYPDIAVRDAVMAVGAYTLGQVAALRGEHWLPGGAAVDKGRIHAAAQ